MKAEKIKLVLSVHAQMVFKFLGTLVKEQNILKKIPKAASEFLFRLSLAVIGKFSLLFFSVHVTVYAALGKFSEYTRKACGTTYRIAGTWKLKQGSLRAHSN